MKKILVFSAPWCGPCQNYKPVLKEIAATGIEVEIVNVDEQPQRAAEYGVRSVPATFIEKDGLVVAELKGVKLKADLLEALS